MNPAVDWRAPWFYRPPGIRIILTTRELVDDLAAWEAILEWLRRHGIDPAEMPVDSLVVIDDLARQIRFMSLVKDEDGRCAIDPETQTHVVGRSVLQLEAPALPLPEAASEWWFA